jgi:hypothetical protein
LIKTLIPTRLTTCPKTRQVKAMPVGEKKRIAILNRLKYAFVMNVIFVGVGVVIALIFSLYIGEVLFSGKVFYPLLAVSFLVAALLEKHLKFKCNYSAPCSFTFINSGNFP